MCVATIKRRRRQAKVGNRHVAKLGRRVYPKKRSAATMARRLANLVFRENERKRRKGAKK